MMYNKSSLLPIPTSSQAGSHACGLNQSVPTSSVEDALNHLSCLFEELEKSIEVLRDRVKTVSRPDPIGGASVEKNEKTSPCSPLVERLRGRNLLLQDMTRYLQDITAAIEL